MFGKVQIMFLLLCCPVFFLSNVHWMKHVDVFVCVTMWFIRNTTNRMKPGKQQVNGLHAAIVGETSEAIGNRTRRDTRRAGALMANTDGLFGATAGDMSWATSWPQVEMPDKLWGRGGLGLQISPGLSTGPLRYRSPDGQSAPALRVLSGRRF